MGGAHHCSEMTYTVSNGTLNCTTPYHTLSRADNCYAWYGVKQNVWELKDGPK